MELHQQIRKKKQKKQKKKTKKNKKKTTTTKNKTKQTKKKTNKKTDTAPGLEYETSRHEAAVTVHGGQDWNVFFLIFWLSSSLRQHYVHKKKKKKKNKNKQKKTNICNLQNIVVKATTFNKELIDLRKTTELFEKVWVFAFPELTLVCRMKNAGAWHALQKWSDIITVAIATERVILRWPGYFIGGKCMV